MTLGMFLSRPTLSFFSAEVLASFWTSETSVGRWGSPQDSSHHHHQHLPETLLSTSPKSTHLYLNRSVLETLFENIQYVHVKTFRFVSGKTVWKLHSFLLFFPKSILFSKLWNLVAVFCYPLLIFQVEGSRWFDILDMASFNGVNDLQLAPYAFKTRSGHLPISLLGLFKKKCWSAFACRVCVPVHSTYMRSRGTKSP